MEHVGAGQDLPAGELQPGPIREKRFRGNRSDIGVDCGLAGDVPSRVAGIRGAVAIDFLGEDRSVDAVDRAVRICEGRTAGGRVDRKGAVEYIRRKRIRVGKRERKINDGV